MGPFEVYGLQFKGHQVRHVVIDGNPWFMAIDVCRCLGMDVEKGTWQWLKALRSLEKWSLRKRDAIVHPEFKSGYVGVIFPHHKGGGVATLISESGLYKLIMRSDKPIASTFQDWVTQDVLPTIRKTGSYSLNGTRSLPPPSQETLPPVHQVPLDRLEPFQPLPGSIVPTA
jgi:prophage antirepressor-like protein